MPLNESLRNELQKTVARIRTILTEDFTLQCKTIYGIQPDGTFIDLAQLGYLSEEEKSRAIFLRDRVEHLAASAVDHEAKLAEAVYRMQREQAFTVLNRLCALRMSEERNLVQECVREGVESKGFQLFEENAVHLGGDTFERYLLFLQLLCDEMSLDLGLLFDRYSPTAILFPTENALKAALDQLNQPALRCIWSDDEAIGWVYQYFNPAEERKAMREASQAPRDSRELAVRNQFFTPRYVVEFLTDNTLGRIWYEMRKGTTALTEECHYLVMKANQVFLGKGERSPVVEEDETLFSQDELSSRPVYIKHRPKKDPRDLRILDPACGSGHFLLYAFDILQRIYEEAWNDPESPESEATGRRIRDDFDTIDQLSREVPRLVIEHNLHGIDIDARAAQIAALALWLRAQKAWKGLGIKAPHRPRIARSNIVVAEPMPGEEAMRREFTAELKPRVLGQMLDEVFERMKFAGEAGSLLRIDEEIKDAVSAAAKQWREDPKPEQQLLFSETGSSQPEQQGLRFDVAGVTDEGFWEQAEERILDALKGYAERADSGTAVRRRLFAEDAARGFAFIDLSRKRYHVVLMNPPFGDATGVTRALVRSMYPIYADNLYIAFHCRAQEFLHPEYLTGVISSRTFITYRDFEEFRSRLTGSSPLVLLADLGWEVLDSAQVETAAYVTEKRTRTSKALGPFFRIVDVQSTAKPQILLQAVRGELPTRRYFSNVDLLTVLPGKPLSYWSSPSLVSAIKKAPPLYPFFAYVGLGASPHSFFFRLWWELDPLSLGARWRRICRGGEFSPYYRANLLVIDWAHDGASVKQYICDRYPYLNGNYGWKIQDERYYFLSGLTWGKRNEKFNAQAMPAGHIFTDEGQGVIPNGETDALFLLGYLNSSVVAYFLSLTSGLQKHYMYVRPVPIFLMNEDQSKAIREATEVMVRLKMNWDSTWEISPQFILPTVLPLNTASSLELLFVRSLEQWQRDRSSLIEKRVAVDDLAISSLPLGAEDIVEIKELRSAFPDDLPNVEGFGSGPNGLQEFVKAVVSYSLGSLMGRWDVRLACDQSLVPQMPSPFAPVPASPPAMLVGTDGLPAGRGQIVSEEWLRARRDAAPANGSVWEPTIGDSDYPLTIAWEGILVDDPGFAGDRPHQQDIVFGLRKVFDWVWGDEACGIEQEVCAVIGVAGLRDYFRRPAGFFQDHLKRYSRNRRKAPIYWPLSSESGRYTLWLYYPRLSDQTLFRCVNDYLDPKLLEIERDLTQFGRIENLSRAACERRDDLIDLQSELKSLRAQLLKIAQLPYKPNLNDGVMINAAPLWQLFRHKPWQSDLKKCWEELARGEYDWSHMAYNIWPERVREVCRRDKSVAIAHGLEQLCEESPTQKVRGRKK